MYYAQIKNGIATDLENALYAWDDNNYCTPAALVNDGKAEPFGVVPVTFVAAPAYDPATHTAVRDGCEQIGGEWRYKWRVDALTPEQIEAAYKATIPQQVTMRQARLALLGAGLLAGVDAAIESLPEPSKSEAKIEWEYAAVVQRNSGLVPAMGAALGMTEAQLDALFVWAAAR